MNCFMHENNPNLWILIQSQYHQSHQPRCWLLLYKAEPPDFGLKSVLNVVLTLQLHANLQYSAYSTFCWNYNYIFCSRAHPYLCVRYKTHTSMLINRLSNQAKKEHTFSVCVCVCMCSLLASIFPSWQWRFMARWCAVGQTTDRAHAKRNN